MIRRELVYVPAKYTVVEHIQAVYSCRHCEQKNNHVPMKKSAVPAPLFPNSGIASPGLTAHIWRTAEDHGGVRLDAYVAEIHRCFEKSA